MKLTEKDHAQLLINVQKGKRKGISEGTSKGIRKMPKIRYVTEPKKIDLFVKLIQQEFQLELQPEYKFHPTRRWLFDYAIIEHKIAIECEGGVWTRGRHTRGAGFIGDMEKYNTATLMGWKVLRVVPEDLLSVGYELVKTALNK